MAGTVRIQTIVGSQGIDPVVFNREIQKTLSIKPSILVRNRKSCLQTSPFKRSLGISLLSRLGNHHTLEEPVEQENSLRVYHSIADLLLKWDQFKTAPRLWEKAVATGLLDSVVLTEKNTGHDRQQRISRLGTAWVRTRSPIPICMQIYKDR